MDRAPSATTANTMPTRARISSSSMRANPERQFGVTILRLGAPLGSCNASSGLLSGLWRADGSRGSMAIMYPCVPPPVWLAFAFFVGGSLHAADPNAEFFEKNVRPVLVEKCQSCHGEKKQ